MMQSEPENHGMNETQGKGWIDRAVAFWERQMDNE